METQQEISLMDLWNMFLNHFTKIVSMVLMGAALSVIFMLLFVTPQYGSRAQLIVVQQQDSSNINLSEIQTSVQLINTYRDILTADSVLSQVNEQMGDQYSMNELRSAISVDQSPNSQAFDVNVVAEQPDEAQQLLTYLISTFEEAVLEIFGEENANISIITPPTYQPNKVSPSTLLYALIGAIIGGIIAVIWILIFEISDTTVKDDEFLQSLGLTNLGSVFELSEKELHISRIGSTRSNGKRSKSE